MGMILCRLCGSSNVEVWVTGGFYLDQDGDPTDDVADIFYCLDCEKELGVKDVIEQRDDSYEDNSPTEF